MLKKSVSFCVFAEESSVAVVEKQISGIVAKATRAMRAHRPEVKKFEVRARSSQVLETKAVCEANEFQRIEGLIVVTLLCLKETA